MIDDRELKNAKQFWEASGENILSIVKKNKVTLLNIDYEAINDRKGWDAAERLSQIINRMEERLKGIHILQCRYPNREGQMKSKWLSESEWLKNKVILHAFCSWTFLPIKIESPKNSIKPEDQRYVYRVQVDKSAKFENVSVSYLADITTAWDGRIIKQNKIQGEDSLDFPYKFAFPRRVVSKINQCLARNFWPVLWCRENYFAWHKMEGGLVQYMGTRGVHLVPYVKSLQMMLEKDTSGSAATLLAFTCFSILKDFFPTYHALEKSAPYTEGKKYIPEQVALCVWSEENYPAQRVANLCCGCFNRYEKSKLPVVDGIALQKNTCKITKLGINEFESKVLQRAPVLWVNRKPEDALLEDGRIISIHVGEDAKYAGVDFSSIHLIADLADQVEYKRLEQHNRFLQEEWRIADPLLKDFIKTVKSEAEHFHYDIDEIDLEIQYSEILREESRSEPMTVLKDLGQLIHEDCQEYLKDCQSIVNRNMAHVFERKVEEKYRECKNQLLRQGRLINRDVFSFNSYYIDAWESMKSYASAVNERVIRKFALLTASANVFVELCVPKECRSDIQDRLHSGLGKVLCMQKKEWWATDIVEKYVFQVLKEGHFARVRGTGSEREDVEIWYDVEQKYFILPSKHYFKRLAVFLPDASISKREFENKLVGEQAIRVEPGKEQMNRTFKVRVVRDSQKPGPMMLQVQAEKFSADFFRQQVVQTALGRMERDATPLRSSR